MLDGISISGYRSFGSKEARISDLSKVNLFIGKNNCGKSNVLRAVCAFESMSSINFGASTSSPIWDNSVDLCRNDNVGSISLGFQMKSDGYTQSKYKDFVNRVNPKNRRLNADVPTAFWFEFDTSAVRKPTQRSIANLTTQLKALGSSNLIIQLSIDSFGGAGNETDCFSKFAERLHGTVSFHAQTRFIHAFRRISNENATNSMSGDQLIQRLQGLQNPHHREYKVKKEQFEKIQSFVRTVLNDDQVYIEVPATIDDIYVVIKGKVLPLNSLGTGIHQVVILAAAVTMESECVFCIEEPEIHCHPELQKQFIRYIQSKTNNQYFIASHSSAFFDLPAVNIYRCIIDEADNTTACDLALRHSDKHTILQDLGYRPSDLLQSNYVIWVEGPSERVYLNYWISSLSPSLTEGLHYTIMFYGGSLRSHLCYEELENSEDEGVESLIMLSRLNRNACMIFDSDKGKAGDAIGESKMRIEQEFKGEGQMTWMTAGRTIENYVPEDQLRAAIQLVHSKSQSNFGSGKFSDRTKMITKSRSKAPIRKVEVARMITSTYVKADLSCLDLKDRIEQLINCIKKSNGLLGNAAG